MAYRKLKIQKRTYKTGKVTKYKNLATFNKECSKRSSMGKIAMLCSLTNIRKLKDGSGMATVRVEGFRASTDDRRGRWLLHFADHGVMKRHLKGRVSAPSGALDGAKRRRRRK